MNKLDKIIPILQWTVFHSSKNIFRAPTVYKGCTRNYGEVKVKDAKIYI